jgi:hypothetical protein
MTGACCRARSRCCGYGPPVVVVRPGDTPAFWLRLQRDAETGELGLGILDAIALLLGDRIAVAVEVHSSDAT